MDTTPPPSDADVVIVGAGFAGLATAAALVARGARSVVVLEREPIWGRHASGKNAAMARRVIEDPVLTALATESLARVAALPRPDGAPPLVARCGGMLVGAAQLLERLMASVAAVPELAATVERLTPDAARALVPALADADIDGAVWSPGCGVADIHALLTAYAQAAKAGGARVLTRVAVHGVRRVDGRVTAVETSAGTIRTPCVVNAAGFGVDAIAHAAGLTPPPMTPVRRHLFVTAAFDGVDPRAPFVWNPTDGYYFRPEGAGLLLCHCDATPWPPEEPPTDPGAREALAEKLDRLVPGLRGVRPTRGWACLRTLTPDGRFVIGEDPRLRGFFWVAGLGGHGMTTSAGVGHVAAAGILDGALPAPYAEAFAPGRLLT